MKLSKHSTGLSLSTQLSMPSGGWLWLRLTSSFNDLGFCANISFMPVLDEDTAWGEFRFLTLSLEWSFIPKRNRIA